MPASNVDHIADPLADKFSLADLRRIAPWVAEEIEAYGVEAVRAEVAGRGLVPDSPQPMTVWVSALTVLRGPLWEALQVG